MLNGRRISFVSLHALLRQFAVLWAALAALCAGAVDASAAVLQQIQSGTVVNTANGVQTVTITSVDPAKSFLIFQVRSNGDRPVNSMLRGRLASATTVEFERATTEATPVAMTIQWYVATYGSGVRVQRGEVTMPASPANVTISAVASTSQAFVLWSKTAVASQSEYGSDDPVAAELTSTTNIQFRTDTASGHTVAWQVVEYTNAADIQVQRGTTAMLTGTLSTTATLATPVDLTRTFVLASFRTAGAGRTSARACSRPGC